LRTNRSPFRLFARFFAYLTDQTDLDLVLDLHPPPLVLVDLHEHPLIHPQTNSLTHSLPRMQNSSEVPTLLYCSNSYTDRQQRVFFSSRKISLRSLLFSSQYPNCVYVPPRFSFGPAALPPVRALIVYLGPWKDP